MLAGLFAFNIFLIQRFFDLAGNEPQDSSMEEPAEQAPPEVYKYGFNIADFHIIEETIKPNTFLSQMLTSQGVPYANV